MEQGLIDLLMMLAAKYPFVLTFFMVMGVLRAIFKPFFALLNAYVSATPSEKDDELLKKIEGSKIYKMVQFVIDWFASIKIK